MSWDDADFRMQEREAQREKKEGKTVKEKALETQVGGDHYKDMAIQPIEFAMKNHLNMCQGNAIKYIVRNKGDNKKKIEDLRKAIHCIELYIDEIEQT